MEQDLEKLIQKQETTRKAVSAILVKNYDIDLDMAMIIADNAVLQTLGSDTATKIKSQRMWKKVKETLPIIGKAAVTIGVIVLAISFIIGAGMFIHACSTAPEQPIVYKAIPQTTRFSVGNEDNSITKTPKGLSDESFQCIYGSGTRNPDARASGCVHSVKIASLNAAMDKAVAEDINGVIWNEPSGDGEVWTVERNSYRFIVTGTKDPNYK